MKALVVEGGAMRGIFASGVLDAFMRKHYNPYHFSIGVSAGVSNLVGYLAHQPKRSYHVITKLATDKRFLNPARFVKGGHLVDVKWLIEESNHRYPLDIEKVRHANPMLATTTNINTGNADYYQLDLDNLERILEATCALPIAYKTVPCFSGGCYTDGGVADSIPVKEAYRRGAKDITVILSHPISYEMPAPKFGWLMQKVLADYPHVASALAKRAENYNQSLEFIRYPPTDAIVRVIAPPEQFAVQRLTKNKRILEHGYQMGLEAGEQHLQIQQGIHGLTDENCHFCI
ncbi:patatin-like phospholipase family protein [Vibrio sp. TRT 21S02]|uniref:patatin-like phospholipase family protein n=1 Tax=Vibrio sp. TRT 21S02 TaxID=3418507 RepID=UPI003CF5D355